LVEEAVQGKLIVGYFTNTMPDYLGVDIDDHKVKASSDCCISPRLKSLYEQVVRCMSIIPNIVLRTPRGLHVYWFLEERLPSLVISRLATETLLRVQCEVRPTTTLSLRIPNKNGFLDPHSLTPVRFNVDIKRYHPALLFGDKYLPDFQFSKNKRGGYKTDVQVSQQKIREKENEFIPILNGDSNRMLNVLIPFYKRCGFDLYSAISRIQRLLEQSPDYDGELKSRPDRLKQRVLSYYRDNPW
ncbi:MAG: hypothetical protein ACW99Q_18975, partial [Candidatus Kariarchaeaceae archaeon]